MTTLYQSSGKNHYFALRGNGQFGNVVRSGWSPCKLSEKKKALIIAAINNSDIDKVYRRSGKIYALFLNGIEKLIIS